MRVKHIVLSSIVGLGIAVGFIQQVDAVTILGDVVALQQEIQSGADVDQVNKYGNTALMKAAINGHPEVGNRLLEANADVNHANNKGNTALDIAIQKNKTETVQAIRKYIDEKQMMNHKFISAAKK